MPASHHMNLLHLHYFHAVAKEGGYTKASKALYIQQSAISRMVSLLEESLGFKLFERVGRAVQLTSQGKLVYMHSQRIFSEVNTLKCAIEQVKNEPQGDVCFGATDSVASYILPKALSATLKRYQNLHPCVYSEPSELIINRIHQGELEFGLLFYIPCLPFGLKKTQVKSYRFHLLVREDCQKEARVLNAFIGSREIDGKNSKEFPTLDKYRQQNPHASIRISSNNLTAHYEMVKQGCGVGLLPSFMIEADLKSGSLIDLLPGEELMFQLYCVEREIAIFSPGAREILLQLNSQV